MSYFAFFGQNKICLWLFFDVLPRNRVRDTYCMAAASEIPVEILLRRRTTATLSFLWWDGGKLEWLLKEIRSPKENCRLSREPFLMLWFFVEAPCNTNLAIRMYWELNLSILRRMLIHICHYSLKKLCYKDKNFITKISLLHISIVFLSLFSDNWNFNYLRNTI